VAHDFLENLGTPGLMVSRGTFAVCCDSYTGCTTKQWDRMQVPIMLRARKHKGNAGLNYVQLSIQSVCVELIVSNRAGAYDF
jgi:hypothetical protein